MDNLKQNILTLLKSYSAEKKKISLLRYELQHPQQVSAEEVLESMAFAKGEVGIQSSVGHISDKTYHIALHYQDQAAAWNQNEVLEVTSQLERIERKLYRLEHCVSQLPEEQAQIISGLFFEGKGQKTLVEELHLSESTVQRYREKALDSLTEMYRIIQESGISVEW